MDETPELNTPTLTLSAGILLAIILGVMALIAVLSFDAGYRTGDLSARIEHLKNDIDKTAAQIKKTREAIERSAPLGGLERGGAQL